MNISFKSDYVINSYSLEHINNDPTDWGLLKIPFEGTKNEIHDILIDGESIEHLIYTGWFENNNQKKFQPATCVWELGFFKIWIHPNLGFMKAEIFEQINNGDYGKNLFENYLLTEDFGTKIDRSFPSNLQKFFHHAYGPKWWKKDSQYLPYKILDFDVNSINLDDLQNYIKSKFIKKSEFNNILNSYVMKEITDYPVIPTETLENKSLQSIFELTGWTNVLNCSIQVMKGKSFIRLHRDDHVDKKAKDHIIGCKKLYFGIDNHTQTFFKLGKAGILPLEKPLMINTALHSHAVVNQSDNDRTIFLAYGF